MFRLRCSSGPWHAHLSPAFPEVSRQPKTFSEQSISEHVSGSASQRLRYSAEGSFEKSDALLPNALPLRRRLAPGPTARQTSRPRHADWVPQQAERRHLPLSSEHVLLLPSRLSHRECALVSNRHAQDGLGYSTVGCDRYSHWLVATPHPTGFVHKGD